MMVADAKKFNAAFAHAEGSWLSMHVQSLSALKETVGSHFQEKARYRGTVRHDPERDREDGFVRFLLFGSFTFGFGFSGAPYTSVSCFYEASEGSTTTVLLGIDLAFVENDEESISRALRHVEHYCRLRLPDKYLAAWEVGEPSN
ncbi:MAG: hypothetical protein ACTH30_15195 [Leucobacter sp.]